MLYYLQPPENSYKERALGRERAHICNLWQNFQVVVYFSLYCKGGKGNKFGYPNSKILDFHILIPIIPGYKVVGLTARTSRTLVLELFLDGIALLLYNKDYCQWITRSSLSQLRQSHLDHLITIHPIPWSDSFVINNLEILLNRKS